MVEVLYIFGIWINLTNVAYLQPVNQGKWCQIVFINEERTLTAKQATCSESVGTILYLQDQSTPI